MGDVTLVVKHTFLEFVDNNSQAKQTRMRRYTDNGAMPSPSDNDTSSTSAPCTPRVVSEPEEALAVADFDCDGIADYSAEGTECFVGVRTAEPSPCFFPMSGPIGHACEVQPYFELPAAFWDGSCVWQDYDPAAASAFSSLPCGFDMAGHAWDPSQDWSHGHYAAWGELDATYELPLESHAEPRLRWAETAVEADTLCETDLAPVDDRRPSGPSKGDAKERVSAMNECVAEDMDRTTVMLRNLPAGFTRDMLIEVLDTDGFAGRYTFVYLPIDFVKQVSLGYALVDLATPPDARELFARLHGCECLPGLDRTLVEPSSAPCSASWSDPHQGFSQLVERYQSSPVMHHSVPDEWKPVVFMGGIRTNFPSPKKAIKAPKIRCSH